MSEGQDYILDCEYNPHGEGLLDLSADQEEEPLDEDNCVILDEEENLPPEPAEPPVPAEPDVDLGSMFACRDRDIYNKDDPPIPASLYSLSQLVRDINSSPTQEDPGVPARSPRTEEALQPVPLDWVTESERNNTPLDPIWEDQKQEVRLQQDPCLPSLSDEPIPLGQGCSRQKFEP